VIVLDSSAAVEWVLQTPLGLHVQRRVRNAAGDLHAPYVLDIEFSQALRNLVRGQLITPSKGAAALNDFDDLSLHRYVHLPFLRRIWELRDNLTAYDAAYVALAEALRVPLVTCDRKIAAAPGHHARVEWITLRN